MSDRTLKLADALEKVCASVPEISGWTIQETQSPGVAFRFHDGRPSWVIIFSSDGTIPDLVSDDDVKGCIQSIQEYLTKGTVSKWGMK